MIQRLKKYKCGQGEKVMVEEERKKQAGQEETSSWPAC
jgi:hypothetical protein